MLTIIDISPAYFDVSSNLLIDFGVAGLAPLSPDVAVMVGLREPMHRDTGILDLKGLGGACLLVVEIVSPKTREIDPPRKMPLYHRVGVPMCVLIDHFSSGPGDLLGYEWAAEGYRPLSADENGRLHLAPLGIRLWLDGRDIRCEDIMTGRDVRECIRAYHIRHERLRTFERPRAEGRERCEADLREAGLLAELASLRQELARLRAGPAA